MHRPPRVESGVGRFEIPKTSQEKPWTLNDSKCPKLRERFAKGPFPFDTIPGLKSDLWGLPKTIRSSSGRPNQGKWGSRTFPEGVRKLFWNPLFKGVLCSIYKQKGVPEPVPDSFPESSRTSLSSVWFAGTTPETTQKAIGPVYFEGTNLFALLLGPMFFANRLVFLSNIEPDTQKFCRTTCG